MSTYFNHEINAKRSLQVKPSPRPYFERMMGVSAMPRMQTPENEWLVVSRLEFPLKRGAADWSRL